MTWEEKEKKWGKPVYGKTYNCKVQHYSSKAIKEVLLKAVEGGDHLWRTADDNSEVDEWNWDLIEWVEVE